MEKESASCTEIISQLREARDVAEKQYFTVASQTWDQYDSNLEDAYSNYESCKDEYYFFKKVLDRKKEVLNFLKVTIPLQ